MPPPKFNKFTNNKAGKLKQIPKVSSPAPVASTSEPTQDESLQQLEVEICWCVQQLEISLQAKNLTPKQGRRLARFLMKDTKLTIQSPFSRGHPKVDPDPEKQHPADNQETSADEEHIR